MHTCKLTIELKAADVARFEAKASEGVEPLAKKEMERGARNKLVEAMTEGYGLERVIRVPTRRGVMLMLWKKGKKPGTLIACSDAGGRNDIVIEYAMGALDIVAKDRVLMCDPLFNEWMRMDAHFEFKTPKGRRTVYKEQLFWGPRRSHNSHS